MTRKAARRSPAQRRPAARRPRGPFLDGRSRLTGLGHGDLSRAQTRQLAGPCQPGRSPCLGRRGCTRTLSTPLFFRWSLGTGARSRVGRLRGCAPGRETYRRKKTRVLCPQHKDVHRATLCAADADLGPRQAERGQRIYLGHRFPRTVREAPGFPVLPLLWRTFPSPSASPALDQSLFQECGWKQL